jgi:hypothetical protein
VIRRKLTFSAWQPVSEKRGFDRVAAAKEIVGLTDPKDQVVDQDGGLTSVMVLAAGTDTKPTVFRLLALHDEADRPNRWEAGAAPTTITLPSGSYTAFVTHVALWPNHVVGHDMWGNAPGLGRLAAFTAKRTDQRVLFRPLYDPSLGDRLDDLEGWRGIDIAIHDPHKRAQAKSMFRGLVDRKVPTINITLGMGRKGARDAYLDPEIAEEITSVIGTAEDFFDGLIIRGHSKTEKTAAGNPKMIEINLLTERLHEPAELEADSSATNLPKAAETVKALERVRRRLTDDGRLGKALEARIGPGGK